MPTPDDPDVGSAETVGAGTGSGGAATVDSVASGDTLGSLPSALPTSTAALPRVAFESYTRLDEFARGGLGRIIRAIDQRTGRTVAIKEMLASSPDAAARFVREALVTANLQHPAIVPVYEVGRWPDDRPFYAMKLVTGRPFHEVIAATRDLDGRLALLPHVAAVADALAYAHEQRVIHRDLKPHNVLCGTHGETVVIDWGLARRLDDSDPVALPRLSSAPPGQTYVGAVLGTPSYMAPEQARAERADERTDVYAIGAILYHLLSSRPPHSGKTIEELLERVKEEAPPQLTTLDRRVPRDLAAICTRAMARERAQRYATAAECASDLRRFMTGQYVLAHHYTRGERVRRFIARHRALLAVAAVAIGILIVFGTVSIRRILTARAEATASRDEARLRLVASHVGRAGSELVAGHADRALAFAIAAAEVGGLSSASRLVAGQALSMLPAIHRRLDPEFTAAAFVPGGHDILVAAKDLVRWNPETDAVAWRLPDASGDLVVVGPTVAVVRPQGLAFVKIADGTVAATVAMSTGAKPDGLVGSDHGRAWLAVVSEDRLDLVDTAARTLAATIPLAGVQRAPLVSPDGQRVLVIRSKQNANEAVIVDRAGTVVATLCDCQLVASAGDVLAFAPMGSPAYLVVADWSGKRVQEIKLGVSPTAALAVDAARGRIALASNDGTLQIRDLATGKPRWQTMLRDQSFDLALDANHAYFVSAALGTLVFHVDSGIEVARVQVAGIRLVSSGDGARVALLAPREGVSTWSLGHELVTPIAPTDARVNALLVGPDHAAVSGSADGTLAELRDGKVRTLATGGGGVITLERGRDGTLITAGVDELVTVRDRDGTQVVQFEGGHFARISPDGKTLATLGREGSVALWDPGTGAKLRELGKLERAHEMAWSSLGQLAVIGLDGTTMVWNVDGSIVRRIGAKGYGQRVTFSHDGKRLALGAGGHTLYALGGGTDRELRRTPVSANVMVADFSADDSKVLLAGTGFLGIWDVSTGEPVFTIATSSLIPAARFIDGDRYVVAGGGDRQLSVWDASTGAELMSLPMPGNVFRIVPDPTSTTLGITTARGAVLWRRTSFEGELAALRALAECRSGVEVHESHVRGRVSDPSVCNRR